MRQTKTRAMATAAFAAGILTSAGAMAADLRAPMVAPPLPVYVAAPFFVNISGMFGNYSMTNTRTSVFSTGPAAFGGQGINRDSGGFTGGVLATFAPFAPFGLSPFFGFATPIFQVGYFGDLNNTTRSTVYPLDAAANGFGAMQTTTRSAVPIMGGISFPVSAVPFPFLNGGFFATTTVQLSAGVQITQRSSSFALLETTGAGAAGLTGVSRRYTTTDPSLAFGTMTPIAIDTPFGRPTLTNNVTVTQSRSRNLIAQSSVVPNQFYIQRVRSGTEFRATSGVGFSFGGSGGSLFAPVVR